MNYDNIEYNLTKNKDAIIKVIGVGGGGSNAVKHLFNNSIGVLGSNVGFICCNTDSQALISSSVPIRVPIGDKLTEGRGAGNQPDIGKQSADESEEAINSILGENTKMVFITAGMGGGTGTGAAPVIAKLAMQKEILTVAVVTIPFLFEGSLRYNQAINGIKELKKHVDSLLVINNEQIKKMYGNLKISEAFAKADDILATATKGIAEIINVPGRIHNANFADIETVIRSSGLAIMGAGSGSGEERATDAVKAALNSPLINNNNIRGAKNVLLNVASGSKEVTANEKEKIITYIQSQLDHEADILFGDIHNPDLGEELMITLIATGFKEEKTLEHKSFEPDVYVLEKKDKKEQKSSKKDKEPEVKEEEETHKKTIEESKQTTTPKENPKKTEKKSGGFSGMLESFFS
jgi:cell division protein FtsZ